MIRARKLCPRTNKLRNIYIRSKAIRYHRLHITFNIINTQNLEIIVYSFNEVSLLIYQIIYSLISTNIKKWFIRHNSEGHRFKKGAPDKAIEMRTIKVHQDAV